MRGYDPDMIPTLADAEVPCDQASPWRDLEGQVRADYLRDDGHDYPVILQVEGCGEHLDVTGGLNVKYLPQSYCDECGGSDDYDFCGNFCPLCSYCCGC